MPEATDARQLAAERAYVEHLVAAGGKVLHRAVDREGNIVLMIEVP